MPAPRKPEPPADVWIATATKHAKALGVNPIEVINGDKKSTRPTIMARWRAWREMLKLYPESNVSGLARVTGFDHSTIFFAMKHFESRKRKYERKHPPKPRIPANENFEARMRRVWKEQAALTRVAGSAN